MINAPEPQAKWPGHHLYVNDGKLPAEMMAPLRATTLDTPIEEVKRRYEEDGYVFLKGLIIENFKKKCAKIWNRSRGSTKFGYLQSVTSLLRQ